MHHSGFVHLHLHTKYSLLDGAGRIEDLVAKAAEYGMPALAITDHGNMFGAIEFYQKAVKAGIKPIIGCETYITRASRHDRTPAAHGDGTNHLILLARNMDGYRNLMRLVSLGYTEGFYYKPRIDKAALAQYSGGLIGLSACMKGEVAAKLLAGDKDGARESALEYQHILGAENFYLEVQDNGMEEQKRLNEMLVELSGDTHIPLVATSDCHYFAKSDARAHEALLCIQTGKTLSDPSRMKFSTDEFYFKSPDEMTAAFEFCPEAISNTVKIAERCNLSLKFDDYHLPDYAVPKGYTKESYLEELAKSGLEVRLREIEEARRRSLAFVFKGESPEKDIIAEAIDPTPYRERLKTELRIIGNMGFPGYFLVVWDFIKYARDNGIPVGPGRGSAAGSLVAYSLGITDIDPMPYGLLFERFLNPERISMPDIDIDFCMDRREEVIEYVREKYGDMHVSQIITFGTMLAKGVIRDVGRVMDIPYGEVDRIAKLVPDTLNITLDEAIKQEPKLKELINSDPKMKELYDTAKVLEGLTRHASKHAAGIVISQEPLTDYAPLYVDPKDAKDIRDTKGEDGKERRTPLVTQYAKDDVEKIGLVKFDFLGLKTLTVVHNAVRMVNERLTDDQPPLLLSSLPLDDPATYKLLSNGDTSGVFQLESSGMRDIIMRLQPNCFEDIIALVALYRPGPLGSGMVDDFIQRKRGRTPIKYDLPQLANILKDTYGVILYQEQVMQIAVQLAGFSMGQADSLRKAMGKKKADVMEKQKESFMKGAVERHVDKGKAEAVFDLMAKFAAYGFNKSHSAAYALIAYQTAYLKEHHPVEFMAALLSSEMGNTDKIVKYINDCRGMGITVLPPDVNRSGPDFTVDDGRIRFGLAAVKNVGLSAIESIIQARGSEGEFTSVYDFCRKVDLRKVNKRVIEGLVRCGAFDTSGVARSRMVEALDKAMESGGQAARDKESGQVSMFGMFGPAEDAPVVEEYPAIPEWSEKERLSSEKDALGFYITGHPLARYEKEVSRFAQNNTAELSEVPNERDVSIAGIINAFTTKVTKKGDKMAILTVEDLQGMVEVVVFPDLYKDVGELLSTEDDPLLISGTLDKSEQTPKIKATKIEPLHAVLEKMTSRVDIKITATGASPEDLMKLREVVLQHKGACRLYLNIRIPKHKNTLLTIKADGKHLVSPTEGLVTDIEGLLGQGAVSFA